MSDLLRSILLGIVQGLTEFLPISSSGHLEILNSLTGSSSINSDLFMVVLVHFGTALSIVYVYRNQIGKILHSFLTLRNDAHSQLGWKIVLSMIPALIVGLLFNDSIESLFEGDILYVGIFLMITGLVLFITPRSTVGGGHVNFRKALLIGIAQAIAILPGISRSGLTISTALFLKTNKSESARFSFLMVLPVIFGKIILDCVSGDMRIGSSDVVPILGALLSSFFVGIWACKWMIRFVEKSQLTYFAYYCFVVGMLTFILSLYG